MNKTITIIITITITIIPEVEGFKKPTLIAGSEDIWVLYNRKEGNYLKKSNLYLYAKNASNIVICSELALT